MPSLPPEADHRTVAALRAAGCVFAEEEARLLCSAAPDRARLEAMVRRRTDGEPLEQILGWAEFCGVRIAVEPDVFVPRRRSQLVVYEALSLITEGARVLDVCCGSGAIGAAVADGCPGVEVHATDTERTAVRCARRNLAPYGGQAYEGDLYAPLPGVLRGQFDVLVANAPYVPTDSIDLMPPEARLYEPHIALDGGADGLDVQRGVIDGAADWLVPGGHLLVETSRAQAPATAGRFGMNGFEARVCHDEELDATVVIGRRRGRR